MSICLTYYIRLRLTPLRMKEVGAAFALRGQDAGATFILGYCGSPIFFTKSAKRGSG